MESILAAGFEKDIVLDAVVPASEAQQQHLLRLREEISAAQKPEGGSIKHDISVPVSRFADFIREADIAVGKIVPTFRSVVFGHIGDGNVHYNPMQPKDMEREEYLSHWEEVSRAVHDIAVKMRGSISAEHGIGRLKADDLVHYKPGIEIDLMRRIKKAFDPDGIMNPGKLLK